MEPRWKAAVPGFIVVFLLVFGCGLPVHPWSSTRPAENPTATMTPIPTKATTYRVTPSDTPGAAFDGSCGWTWANQDLPDLTDELQKVFDEAGMDKVDIRASAYGENCLDSKENRVVRFAAMQTDFYLVIHVKDTANHQTSGEWIAKVIKTLEPYTAGRVPGPNPGYIGIRFVSPANEENLWFQRTEAEKLLNTGKTGSEVYDALR